VSGGRAAGALRAVVSDREPIGLLEVLATAGLQSRIDRKYLLTAEQLTAFADRLSDGFRVLDVDGRRLHGYESIYFDTPCLDCYHAHRQGRRRRYKVRTRCYTDTQEQLIEVKFEGRRGSTDKRRLPCTDAAAAGDDLAPSARQFVDAALAEYDVPVPRRLDPALLTSYRRATIVDPIAEARVTLDVDMRFAPGDRLSDQLHHGPDRVLVESKSTGSSIADSALAELGVRPVSLSKYCVGMALTRPHLPANRWSRLLRQQFGWVRAARRAHPGSGGLRP